MRFFTFYGEWKHDTFNFLVEVTLAYRLEFALNNFLVFVVIVLFVRVCVFLEKNLVLFFLAETILIILEQKL